MNANGESAVRRFVDRLRVRYDVAGALHYGAVPVGIPMI